MIGRRIIAGEEDCSASKLERTALLRVRAPVAVPAKEQQIRLHVTGPTSAELSLALRSYRIGKSPANDIAVSDPYVSRHHCQLKWLNGQWWLEDLGSRNGTWISGLRVERCLLRPMLRVEVGRTTFELKDPAERSPFQHRHNMVGQHPLVQRVHDLIDRLGRVDCPVLILGETGTGKELVARAVHRSSARQSGAFEVINCAAIPRELAESELFGHVKGAFSGAFRNYRGAFERAHNGTLFLDEIGELPLELQPKLLRALEEGLVRPVGAEHARKVDVRIVAATHRNLERESERGRFRLDLYHRLAVGVVNIPPLRERPEDIALLVHHFFAELSALFPVLPELGGDVLPYLASRPWPGNVRALRNALHRAVMQSGRVLRARDFAFLQDTLGAPAQEEGSVAYVGRSFADVRKEIYFKTVQRCGGNRSAAAQALGIPKSTFFDQLRAIELGQDPEKLRDP